MSGIDLMPSEEVLRYSMAFALMKALRIIRKGTPIQQVTDDQRHRMAEVVIRQLRSSNVRIEQRPPGIAEPGSTAILAGVKRGPG